MMMTKIIIVIVKAILVVVKGGVVVAVVAVSSLTAVYGNSFILNSNAGCDWYWQKETSLKFDGKKRMAGKSNQPDMLLPQLLKFLAINLKSFSVLIITFYPYAEQRPFKASFTSDVRVLPPVPLKVIISSFHLCPLPGVTILYSTEEKVLISSLSALVYSILLRHRL